MSDFLSTENLTVGYDGQPLIREVCLSVQRGRIVTLIGPNGSGKSTILKTVVGQLSKVPVPYCWREAPWSSCGRMRSLRKWPFS